MWYEGTAYPSGKKWKQMYHSFPGCSSVTAREKAWCSVVTWHLTQLSWAVSVCLPRVSWDLIGLEMGHNYAHTFSILLRWTANFTVIYFFMTDVYFSYFLCSRPNNDLPRSLWFFFFLPFFFLFFFILPTGSALHSVYLEALREVLMYLFPDENTAL